MFTDNDFDQSAPHREDTAIVLLSGGLDSTVALAETLREMPVQTALTFNYGQRAYRRELRAAQALCDHYKIPHRVIELSWLAELLPQALTPSTKTDFAVEPGRTGDADFWDVNRVWVPNRNGLFLNIAATLAEATGCRYIVFGANAEEGESFPDNTPEFRDALNRSLSYSTLNGVTVKTPVGGLTKKEIIERGIALKVPLQHVWSCYEGNDAQCGQCPSCLRLKAASDVAREKGYPLEISFAG